MAKKVVGLAERNLLNILQDDSKKNHMIPNFTRMKKKLFVHNDQEMAKMSNDSLGESQIQQS